MEIQSTKQQLNKRICKENSSWRVPFVMVLICVGQLSKWEADKRSQYGSQRHITLILKKSNNWYKQILLKESRWTHIFIALWKRLEFGIRSAIHQNHPLNINLTTCKSSSFLRIQNSEPIVTPNGVQYVYFVSFFVNCLVIGFFFLCSVCSFQLGDNCAWCQWDGPRWSRYADRF
jgi:hypothetical protein